jgi:TrpR-related protein YerC/YecD
MTQAENPVEPDGQLERLCDAIVGISSRDAAAELLDDLCTPREIEDLAQRLEVARMLDAGVSYARIQAATGASATTVARVARCLKGGSGGYRRVLAGLPPYRDAR